MRTKFGPRYKVPFRRRREGKTNYHKRLALIKSELPRAVVRKSLKHTTVQIIKYSREGDQILTQASSKELHKLGWSASTSNLPAAYLTGLLAGKRAIGIRIDSAVLDIGLYTPVKGSRLFASLCGIIDAGISISTGKDILPNDDRIVGKHISDSLPNDFEKIKNKILNGSNKSNDVNTKDQK